MLFPTLKMACLCWTLCCQPTETSKGMSQTTLEENNPLWLPGKAEKDGDYGRLFEKVLSVLGDDFKIAESNRYEGRVETFHRLSLDNAGAITRRDRAVVRIMPDNKGGFLVEVKVFHEIRPVGSRWIPFGRDLVLEQKILNHLAREEGPPCGGQLDSRHRRQARFAPSGSS